MGHHAGGFGGEADRPATSPISVSPAAPLARLIAVIQELSRAGDLPRVQEIVRRAARDLTGADGAAFVLLEGEHCFYADEDAIQPLWKGRRFRMDDCVSGWAMRRGVAIVVPDTRSHPDLPRDLYDTTFVKSLVMVPIRAAAPLGAIGTYWSTPRAASAADVETLQALADSTAIAIEHVRLLADLEARVEQRTADLAERMRRLEDSERQRRALASEAMDAEERERARLSEVLHDDALQYLLAARQEVAEAAKGEPEALERARTHLDAATRRVRELVADLSPLTLKSSTPSETVRAIVRTHTEGRGWHVVTRLEEDARTKHVPLLRRATHELLMNIAKHAQARKVTVMLRRHGDEVELCVADDGVGFEPAALPDAVAAGHIGLASLRGRAEAVGGRLGIRSSPAGTEITVTVPAG